MNIARIVARSPIRVPDGISNGVILASSKVNKYIPLLSLTRAKKENEVLKYLVLENVYRYNKVTDTVRYTRHSTLIRFLLKILSNINASTLYSSNVWYSYRNDSQDYYVGSGAVVQLDENETIKALLLLCYKSSEVDNFEAKRADKINEEEPSKLVLLISKDFKHKRHSYLYRNVNRDYIIPLRAKGVEILEVNEILSLVNRLDIPEPQAPIEEYVEGIKQAREDFIKALMAHPETVDKEIVAEEQISHVPEDNIITDTGSAVTINLEGLPRTDMSVEDMQNLIGQQGMYTTTTTTTAGEGFAIGIDPYRGVRDFDSNPVGSYTYTPTEAQEFIQEAQVDNEDDRYDFEIVDTMEELLQEQEEQIAQIQASEERLLQTGEVDLPF